MIEVKGAIHQFYIVKVVTRSTTHPVKTVAHVLSGFGSIKSEKTAMVTSLGLSRLGLGGYKFSYGKPALQTGGTNLKDISAMPD